MREVISGADILHLLDRRQRTGSRSLDDHQRVAFGVAEPEQWRDGVAEAADLGVDVHAAVLQLRFDVRTTKDHEMLPSKATLDEQSRAATSEKVLHAHGKHSARLHGQSI